MNVRDIKREFAEVPIALIDEPEHPARASMDEQKLDDLTESIRAIGLIQPISVARLGERYEVIAGHRRRLAAARAGLVAMLCVIYPSKELALEAVKTAENGEREDLNPAEEAIYFHELLEGKCGGDVDRLCDVVKRKRPYVEGRLLLFQGDEHVFARLQEGKITIGVAHELNRCSDHAHRRMFLHQAIVGGATIAVVKGWIDEWKRYAIHLDGQPSESAAPAPLAPVAETNYFTCRACGKADNLHTMRPINFHSHCELAILAPALDQHAQRGSTIAFPRTVEGARALVGQLVDAFPMLGEA